MIIEVAQITIRPGTDEAFEAAVQHAVGVFARAQGCKGLHLQRCIEDPDIYEVIIRWDRLEDHTESFKSSPLFQEWRNLVGEFFLAPPIVRHFEVAMQRADF